MNKIFRQIYLGFIIIFFAMSFSLKNTNLMFVSIILILSHNIIYSCEKFQKRIVFLGFQITFFTFLIGSILISFINKESAFNFADDVVIHIYVSLFISLFSVYLGYGLTDRKSKKSNINIGNNITSKNTIYLTRKVSKWLFFITYIPYIMIVLEKVLFVQNSTYISYYTDFSSNLPFLFIKIGEMSVMTFFVFLATMPTKKECKIPVMFYLFHGILSLGMGQRNQAVLSILMVLIYYVTRNAINPNNELWLGKKKILALICIIPLSVVFLQVFSFIRTDQIIEEFSFSKMFIDFFDQQGGSVGLIGHGYVYSDSLPKQNYVFGPIISFFKNNIFTKLFFEVQTYQGHTVEMALHGNSFGQTITYLIMPHNYLSGVGMGSCYIAEAYQDFGYIGICVINILYGLMLAKFTQYFNKNILITSISFLFVYNILYTPRDTALAFVTAGLNLINILTIVIIFTLAKLIYSSKKKRGVINEQIQRISYN